MVVAPCVPDGAAARRCCVFPAYAGVNRSRSLDAGDASIGVLVEQLLQDFAGAEEAGVGPPIRRQSPGKSSCSPQTSDEAFIRQDR